LRARLDRGAWLHALPIEFPPLRDVEAFLAEMGARLSRPFQCVRQEAIASPLQLLLGAAQAYEAWRSGSAYAKRLEIELLLRIAATSQVEEALRRVGLRPGSRRAWLVALSLSPRAPSTQPLARPLTLSSVERPPLEGLLRAYGVKREALRAYLLLGADEHDALAYHLCELAALELARR